MRPTSTTQRLHVDCHVDVLTIGCHVLLCGYSAPPTCTFDNSYYNMIAPSLTDYNPGVSSGSIVAYYLGPDVAHIRFENVPLFYDLKYSGPDAGVNHSFVTSMYPSGKIVIRYYTVSDPATIHGWNDGRTGVETLKRPWMVALRQPEGVSKQNEYQQQWETTSNATYVPRSEIVSNRTLTFVPIAARACNSPRIGYMNGTTVVKIRLKTYQHPNNFDIRCRYVYNQGNDTTLIAIQSTVANATFNSVYCQPPPQVNTSMVTIEIQLLIDGLVMVSGLQHTYVNGGDDRVVDVLNPSSDSLGAVASVWCADCHTFEPGSCYQDCSGDWLGSAYIDDCGVCSEGRSGRSANAGKDCQGVCFGPNTVFNGTCQCANNQQCLNLTTIVPLVGGDARAIQYLLTLSNYTAPLTFQPNSGVAPPFDSPLFLTVPVYSNTTFVPLSLSFPFSYFGVPLDTVYVNPTGVVYANRTQYDDCVYNGNGQWFSQGLTDCAPSYAMIAGSMTEYDLQRGGTIGYYADNTVMSIRYTDLPLYYTAAQLMNVTSEQELRYRFQINLYASGLIETVLLTVYDASQIVGGRGRDGRNWLVGLITSPYPSTVASSVSPSSGVERVGMFSSFESEWHRTPGHISGIFPPRAKVVGPDTTVSYCSIAINICISPRYGPARGGQIVRVAVGNTDCVRQNTRAVTCRFGSHDVPAVYNLTTGTLNCIAPSGVPVSAVPFNLAYNGVLIGTNAVFYGYYPDSDPLVDDTSLSSLLSLDQLCTDCSVFSGGYCHRDCAGSWRGAAVIDDCGRCVGGMTHIQPNQDKDCLGICQGMYRRQPITNQCTCTGNDTTCAKVPLPVLTTTALQRQYAYQIKSSSTLLSHPSHSHLLSTDVSLLSTTGVPVSFPDGNLTLVWLPFTFRFFSTPYRRVYVSPHGAVYFNPLSSHCLVGGSASLFEGDNTCQHTLIAGGLTEYDHTRAEVTLDTTDTYITIHYALSLWTAPGQPAVPIRYRFSISLYDTGRIVVSYVSVSDPVQYSGGSQFTRRWLVGIYQGWREEMMTFPFQPQSKGDGRLPTNQPTQQELQYLNSTKPTGIYPDRSTVLNGVSLTFCSLGHQYCLSPSIGWFGTIVSIAGLEWGCVGNTSRCCIEEMTVECDFGGIQVPATFNRQLMAVQCQVPAGAENATVLVALHVDGRPVGSVNRTLFTYRSVAASSSVSDLGVQLCRDCGVLNHAPSYCVLDCAGSYRGLATFDDCDQCVGPGVIPSRQRNVDKDCEGICFGPFLYRNDTPFAPQCSCESSEDINKYQLYLCAFFEKLDGPIDISTTLDVLVGYKWALIAAILVCLILSCGDCMVHCIRHRPLPPGTASASAPSAYAAVAARAQRRQEERAGRQNMQAALGGITLVRPAAVGTDATTVAPVDTPAPSTVPLPSSSSPVVPSAHPVVPAASSGAVSIPLLSAAPPSPTSPSITSPYYSPPAVRLVTTTVTPIIPRPRPMIVPTPAATSTQPSNARTEEQHTTE